MEHEAQATTRQRRLREAGKGKAEGNARQETNNNNNRRYHADWRGRNTSQSTLSDYCCCFAASSC